LLFLSQRVSSATFDFIDNFDQAVFLAKGEGSVNSSGDLGVGKEFDRCLGEKCGRPLPQNLKTEIYRYLSFGTTQLAKTSAILNFGRNEWKGSFILSLAFSSSMFKNTNAVESGAYGIIVRSSDAKSEYSLSSITRIP